MEDKKVYIDEDLKAIIPQFFRNREDDIENIKEFLAEDNYEEIRIIGHSMKGSGGGYGFDYITEIGKKIEDSAVEKNEDRIRDSIKKLEEYIQNVTIVYK